MSEQKNYLRKEFIKHSLGHVGSCIDEFKIELVLIAGREYWHIYLHHNNYNIEQVCNSL